MKPLRLSVALQLLLVFASGALVGGLAYRLYSTRGALADSPKKQPPPGDRGRQFRERYIQEMRSRLKLRDDQVQKLTQIMDATSHRFLAAKKQSDVAMKSLHEDQIAQIRAMLDPPQVAEYQKMLEEREKQMARDREKGRRRRP